MKILYYDTGQKLRTVVIFFTIFLMITGVAPQAHSHGGKTHGENEFTPLEAIKKAISLYDKLISSQKIDQSWENDLVNVEVGKRKTDNSEEYVVSFRRNNSNTNTLYIFFNLNGEYVGSNFTGR